MPSFSPASRAKPAATPVWARLGVSWFRKMRFPAKASVIRVFLVVPILVTAWMPWWRPRRWSARGWRPSS